MRGHQEVATHAPDRLPPLRPTPGDRVPLRRGGPHPAARSRHRQRRRLGGLPVPAPEPEGDLPRALGPRAWLPALVQRGARHRHRPVPRRLPDGCRGARGRAGADAVRDQRFRLAEGGRIDRAAPVRFRFDGRAYEGCAGDTLASALLANGVHLVGRSFKYHRPRGILSAGAEEPNALVEVERDGARRTPNVRATVQELYDGLAAHSQNRWPSLAFDVGAVNGLASPMLAAGFYYKTFMWPKTAWKSVYEPNIRSAAGLGVAPDQPDPDHYAARYAHCEVLVVGGGAAGLAAALAAAESGARVILADEQPAFGGALKFESGAEIDGQ